MLIRNTANLEIEQPQARIRQALEFISFLTHEFKTPLSSIITSAGLLAEEMAVSADDPKARLIGNILAASHNLEDRASELLELARLEAEGFDLELEPMDINAVVHKAVEQLSPIIHSRGQSLTLQLAPHIPRIAADSLRVEQILLNLLSNATKFSPQGSDIFLTTHENNSYLLIEVQNSGQCIPLEEQSKLFQPYYRIKSNKEHVSGVGLGLALCKHLVELHGGKIWLRSEPGKNTTFAFSLPIRPVFVTSLDTPPDNVNQ